MGRVVLAAVAVSLAVAASAARAEDPIEPIVVDGGIPQPWTSAKGDPARGRAVVLDNKEGNCIACHHVSALKEADFQGEIGPWLDGVADRYSVPQLRLILTNAKLMFPGVVMPAFHRNAGFRRVLPEYAGKPILSGQQVEDVIAFLETLH